MTEPDVTLTDYALAVECLVFAVLLARSPTQSSGLRFWCAFFFAAVSAASFLGGTVHGFYVDESTRGYAILWPATMIAIGVSSLAAWVIGAHLMHFRWIAPWVIAGSIIQLVIHIIIVIFHNEQFWVAILNNLPAVLFLLAVLFFEYFREERKGLLPAACGLVLNIAAGILQQFGVGLNAAYFNHNALYHVNQAIALLLFFIGCRQLVRHEPVLTNEPTPKKFPAAEEAQ